ncbi:hypothetical protein [Leptospira adleri]|uniref:hypothetical protein n=1 Tax=Leptospira adleri TaxID=2023186 RepID=UPI001A9C3700|nr:hypothetical protein [Leptospira adleri]
MIVILELSSYLKFGRISLFRKGTRGFALILRLNSSLILLVALLPITQVDHRNDYRSFVLCPLSASVPLSVAAIPFLARLVESTLCEISDVVLEAAVFHRSQSNTDYS